MSLARVSTAVAACVVLGAAAAACSGSFGSGTGLPNTMATLSPGGNASPTPPSTSSSVILTYGESTAFQALPEVGGYGGSIAFPKAAEPTAAPSPKGKPKKDATPEPAPTPVAVSIGATLSIVKPQDGPDLNFLSGKGKRKRNRELPARAFAYITLLPTHDATLESYPRIQIDVPREVASQYRDGEFGLAMWNSGEKDSKYRLAVAELDTVATPPPLRQNASVAVAVPSGSAGPSAKPGTATSAPTAAATTAGKIAFSSPAPGSSPSPGAGTTAPSAAPTLPPARLLFAGTAMPLKLVANRPAVFALYALPHPAVPKASIAPAASGSSAAPHPAASGAAATTPSASPAPSKT